MRNLHGNSMVGGERKTVKYLMEQKTMTAIQHSWHPSHPHLLPSIFSRLYFTSIMKKHILCASAITDSLNYSLFSLQLGGFMA